jgi:hypothetical protein
MSNIALKLLHVQGVELQGVEFVERERKVWQTANTWNSAHKWHGTNIWWRIDGSNMSPKRYIGDSLYHSAAIINCSKTGTAGCVTAWNPVYARQKIPRWFTEWSIISTVQWNFVTWKFYYAKYFEAIYM